LTALLFDFWGVYSLPSSSWNSNMVDGATIDYWY
jgi:hypothetical protein